MLASAMADGPPLVEIAELALLARLRLTADEQALYRQQLADILAYARQVTAIATDGVAPTTHVPARRSAERPDAVQPSLTQADVLANAPEPAPGFGLLRVPRVIT